MLLTMISSNSFSQVASDIQAIPKPLGDEAFNAVQEFFKYALELSLLSKTTQASSAEILFTGTA